jgi:DNA-binding NarL/FixJ family response regulator
MDVAWAAKAKTVSFLHERANEFDELLSSAQEGRFRVPPELRNFLREHGTNYAAQNGAISNPCSSARSHDILSRRERSIIEFIANGHSNKQIARTLGVTPETVKTYVKRIFIKLSAETRLQAVVRAQSLGLLRNIQATIR